MQSRPDSKSRGIAAVAGPLRSALRALALAAWTAGMTQAAVGALRFAPVAQRRLRAQRWARAWARGLLEVFGVDARWLGARVGPAAGARLVLANHRSPLDII